ncbi:MAG: chemotaxis response regulator protein-glutamate methylesterase [Polyangiaceae bacterium]
MAISVVIIDDSSTVRSILTRVLSAAPDIEVVGAAPDPFVGRDLIVKLQPDVVLLDLEMPRMDGLTFLRKLMQYRPMPVIIVSSLTLTDSALMLEALRSGAVDVVSKPNGSESVDGIATELISRIRLAAAVTMGRGAVGSSPLSVVEGGRVPHRMVAIGASTGGTLALERVLTSLPKTAPAILIVQHMPGGFTGAFAARLNELCEIEVKEAAHGDRVVHGRALIAPGSSHMRLHRSGTLQTVALSDEPPVNRHRPAVDVLFDSVAERVGRGAVGVLLTGMGEDGARGLLKMRQAGATTIAQDEESCVVYGMPRAAVERGAAEHVLPLNRVAAAIMSHATRTAAQPVAS